MPQLLLVLFVLAAPAAGAQEASPAASPAFAADSPNKRFNVSIRWSPADALYEVRLSERRDGALRVRLRWSIPLAPRGMFVTNDGRHVVSYGMTADEHNNEVLGVDVYALNLEHERARKSLELRGPAMIRRVVDPEQADQDQWSPRGAIAHDFDGEKLTLVLAWDSPVGIPRLTTRSAAKELHLTVTFDLPREDYTIKGQVDRAVWHALLLVGLVAFTIVGRVRNLIRDIRRGDNDARMLGPYSQFQPGPEQPNVHP